MMTATKNEATTTETKAIADVEKIVRDARQKIDGMNGKNVKPEETKMAATNIRDGLFFKDGDKVRRRSSKTALSNTRILGEVASLIESGIIGHFNKENATGEHVRHCCVRVLDALTPSVAASIASTCVAIATATVHGGDRLGKDGTCLSAVTLGLLNVAEGKSAQLARLF